MNNNRRKINQQPSLPQGLLDCAPIHNIEDPHELINFWRQVLHYRERFPQLQEDIAIFAVSTGSGSRLTNDNDIFEAVHAQFGELETSDKSEKGWAHVAALINEAESTLAMN